MPARRRELGAGCREVRHVAQPPRLAEGDDAGMGNQRLLAGDIDDDVGGGTQDGPHLRDISWWECGFAAERNGGLGAGIADDEAGLDPHPLALAQDGHAIDAAVGAGDLDRRRPYPDLAITLDGGGQRVPDADRALRAEAEALEGALTGEI